MIQTAPVKPELTQTPEDSRNSLAKAICRSCGTPLVQTMVDLGMSPLCESFLSADQLDRMEPFYPLLVRVCHSCFLAQLEAYVPPEAIFTEYAYFSSYADSWVEHARRYVEMAIPRFGLDEQSLVVELASNDGYLLQHFVERGIPVLGVEPALNVARAAIAKGIPTRTVFFGVETARELARERKADLVIGNNVFAHVPDLHDFTGGMKAILAEHGVITLEFPHLLRLIDQHQFDTIYHEHFSYFSLMAAQRALAAHGLAVFAVDELPTHGGSLRLYACHEGDAQHPVQTSVSDLREREEAAGLTRLETYQAFGQRVAETKHSLLRFLMAAKRRGKSVAGYGAPGKGNTLLNYCGIRTDLLDYTVDRNPYKHGKFLPGTHIPIYDVGRLAETQPDYILILPWNLEREIVQQLAYTGAWGAQLVVPIPTVRLVTPSAVKEVHA